MHGRIAGAAIGAGVTLMLAAPAAGAATRTVEVGPFGAAAGKFEAATGDKITWHMNGFHSVTFQPEGDPAPSLVAPDPAHPVAGINDADGKPFWFNGQPTLAVNPLAAFPQGNKTFNPGELTSSGLPLAPG